MNEIIYDLDLLHKSSVNILENELDETVKALLSTIPGNALGLAAPQIGVHKRIFIARLSIGQCIFINPKITWLGPDKVPSIESCLSIPNTSVCIERHSQIKITADKILITNAGQVRESHDELRFRDMDAFIVQHENDHLDGKIITDYPETKTKEERLSDKFKKRQEKIALARNKRKIVSSSSETPTSKKIGRMTDRKANRIKKEKLKQRRAARSLRRRNQMRVEIEERHKAEKEGLINKDGSKISDFS